MTNIIYKDCKECCCSFLSSNSIHTKVFCSTKCSNIWFNKPKICYYCKKEYKLSGIKLKEYYRANKSKYCSKLCSNLDNKKSQSLTKINKTSAEKEVTLNKREETNLYRYGFLCIFNNPTIRLKAKESIFNKYGVYHYFQHPDFFAKASLTYATRHNNNHYENDTKGQIRVNTALDKLFNTTPTPIEFYCT